VSDAAAAPTPPDAFARIRELVHLRPMAPGDVDFLYSTWLHSYWDGDAPALRDVSKPLYFRGQQGLIDDVLQRSSVLVACDPLSHDDAFGWACFEVRAGILVWHYTYVKKPFRRMHLASFLLVQAAALGNTRVGVSYTHQTRLGRRLMDKFRGVYNPYLTR